MNEKPSAIFSVHGVRYQVMGVARAVAVYTNHLGFKVGNSAPARVCQCVARGFYAAAQWAGSVGRW